MKLSRNTDLRIAINTIDDVFTQSLPLNYEKWVGFVESHLSEFIWNENTKDGIEILKDIDNVPEGFRERVLGSLNKVSCYAEFNDKKGYYDINVGFSSRNNWISINFERTPKLEDLNIFFKMANHLNALLLVDGKTIIDENSFNELS